MSEAVQARAGYRSLFRNRDYRLLFSGLTISMSGSWAYNVALVVFVFNTTHSAGWVAAASMTRFLTALVSSPFGGLLADRLERVRLMVSLDLLAMTFQVLLAIAAALNAPVVLAIAFAALTSVSTASYDPAARATTPSIVGEEHLAAANSVQSAVENLSIIVGPAIGALLLLLGPPPVVFAVNAATFAFSALVVSRIRGRNRPSDISEGGTVGPLRQMATGIKAFAESSTVTLLAGFSVLASFVYGTDTVLFVVVSKDQLGTGSTGYGYLLAALGVGGIVMAGLMNRIASARRLGAIIVVGMAAYCLPTALLTVVHAPVIAAAIQVVRGAGTIVVDVLAITALQRLVKPDVVARVFGVFFALVLAAISLGALLMPILLGIIGLTNTLLVMGFAIPALTALSYPWIRALDSQALGQLKEIEPRVAVLQTLDIFAGATRAALERLARSSVEQSIAAGTVIIREGAEADDFFVLTDGQVEIIAAGEAGVERVIGILNPPNYFGEIGLLEHRPRTATVRALTACMVYRINGVDFVEALTIATLSPGALGSAQMRLTRTHPSQSMTFAAAHEDSERAPALLPAPPDANERRVETLAQLDIFAGAPRAELERLAKATQEDTVPPNTVIVSEGDVADDVFVVASGSVQVSAVGEGELERVLGVLAAPNYIGEIGVLEHRPRTATVRTLSECTLYRITASDFLAAMRAAGAQPSALVSAQARLARTHPSAAMQFDGDPSEGARSDT